MLRGMQNLDSLAVGATGGAIGHVKDSYVDNSAWGVRCLVVETGSWLAHVTTFPKDPLRARRTGTLSFRPEPGQTKSACAPAIVSD